MCGLSFLRHNRLYHLRLFSLCWKRNWDRYCQPLATSEPQKVVRTAEAGKECPYVSVRASRIGIYGHTSLWGFGLFTLSYSILSIFLFVESGTGIGTANHLPLTGEPQKVVCTAVAWEEYPYVSVRTSRIGIYGHTSFCGSSACSRFQASLQRLRCLCFHAVPHFGDVPFNLPLVTLTSILRLPDDASGGHSRSAAKVTPGFAGKARSSLLFCEKNLQPYG